jgi:hypothetical protein
MLVALLSEAAPSRPASPFSEMTDSPAASRVSSPQLAAVAIGGSFPRRHAIFSLSDAPRVAKAARAISRLARSHASFQVALARADGIAPLVTCLRQAPATPRARRGSIGQRSAPNVLKGVFTAATASAVLSSLPPSVLSGSSGHLTSIGADPSGSSGDPKPCSKLSDADAAKGRAPPSPVSTRKKSGVPLGSLRAELSAALWSLSDGDADNQEAVAEAGALPVLVRLLSSAAEVGAPGGGAGGAESVQRDAAGALWSLAASARNQQRIAECDAIGPLIGLVTDTAKGAQETAAGALQRLAARDDNRIDIAACGGVRALVSVFESGVPAAKEQAAGALAALVVQNEVYAAAMCPPNVAQSATLSICLAPSASLLTHSPSRQRRVLTCVSHTQPNQHAVAVALVRMLNGGSGRGGDGGGGGSHAHGGVMRTTTTAASEDVTRLIAKLAETPENRDALAKAGCIPQLATQLRDGSSAAQTAAASALSQIALKSAQHRVQVTQVRSAPLPRPLARALPHKIHISNHDSLSLTQP